MVVATISTNPLMSLVNSLLLVCGLAQGRLEEADSEP